MAPPGPSSPDPLAPPVVTCLQSPEIVPFVPASPLPGTFASPCHLANSSRASTAWSGPRPDPSGYVSPAPLTAPQHFSASVHPGTLFPLLCLPRALRPQVSEQACGLGGLPEFPGWMGGPRRLLCLLPSQHLLPVPSHLRRQPVGCRAWRTANNGDGLLNE